MHPLHLLSPRVWILAIVLLADWLTAGPLVANDAVIPLPPVDPIDQSFFTRIRLAALGDPQDLTEPLLPDGLAPPGQPSQEFSPPAGRKLPPGAKPGPLQQLIFTTTELPRLGDNGLGLTWLETSATIGMPAPTVDSPLLVHVKYNHRAVQAQRLCVLSARPFKRSGARSVGSSSRPERCRSN